MRLRTLLAIPMLAVGTVVSFLTVAGVVVASMMMPLADYGPPKLKHFAWVAAASISSILPLTAWLAWKLGGRDEARAGGEVSPIGPLLILTVLVIVGVMDWLCLTWIAPQSR